MTSIRLPPIPAESDHYHQPAQHRSSSLIINMPLSIICYYRQYALINNMLLSTNHVTCAFLLLAIMASLTPCSSSFFFFFSFFFFLTTSNSKSKSHGHLFTCCSVSSLLRLFPRGTTPVFGLRNPAAAAWVARRLTTHACWATIIVPRNGTRGTQELSPRSHRLGHEQKEKTSNVARRTAGCVCMPPAAPVGIAPRCKR